VRILSIGYPLPNPSVDNYSALTAPSYNDYDGLLVDPATITKQARDLGEQGMELEAFDGRPILNAPTTASSASAAEQFRRRIDETRRFLDAGGLVVVLARPNAVEGGVLGFEGLDRYHWLPAPGGLSWGPPFLRAAEGRTVRVTGAEDHPFTALLREFRGDIGYRAMFDDRQAEIRKTGRVLALGGAGVPIAMEFPVLGGRVVFLPVIAENPYANRTTLAQGIVDAFVRHGGSEFGAEAPYWSGAQALPGLEQIEAELEEAEAAAAESRAHLEAVREKHDALARHRRLLWEDGQPFTGAVVEALRLLGFAVEYTAGEPLSLEHEGNRAFVEVESAREQVVEWPYIRLQRRLEEHLLTHGESLKGIVIANGFREKDPEQREEELSSPLRIACENYRYSLLSTRSLFELVRRTLAGADEATLLGVRRRIMQGAGVLSVGSLTGEESEETSSSGPIF
jgi:hypothetical protein